MLCQVFQFERNFLIEIIESLWAIWCKKDWMYWISSLISWEFEHTNQVYKAAGLKIVPVGRVMPQIMPIILPLPTFLYKILAASILRIDPQARTSMFYVHSLLFYVSFLPKSERIQRILRNAERQKLNSSMATWLSSEGNLKWRLPKTKRLCVWSIRQRKKKRCPNLSAKDVHVVIVSQYSKSYSQMLSALSIPQSHLKYDLPVFLIFIGFTYFIVTNFLS